MKSDTSLAAAIVASLIFPLSLNAQTAKSNLPSPTPSTFPSKQPTRPIPFHGMVSAVDQKNKTFTISGKEATRMFKVTHKTSIMKGAATETMKDIADNEEVSGAYWKNSDGTLEAKFVKLGPHGKESCQPSAESVRDAEVLVGVRRSDRDPEIGDEVFVFAVSRFFIRLAQQRRRMARGHDFWRELR